MTLSKTPIDFGLGGALLALLLCVSAPSASAQTAEEIAVAREVFTKLQAASIQQNREYCGYIGYNPAGQLVSTEAKRGRKTSCRPRNEPEGWTLVASFHTHGAYTEDYDNEVPSVTDVEGDMDEEVNGFVATPGGRFWAIDGTTGDIRLICGPRCLPWDPNFVPDYDPPLARYSLDTLKRRFGED
ncbi:MAG: DUF4329 domain-containing protein [Pseudomonadota bacterium]